MAFRHCCHAGGLGILSKYPIVEDEYIPTRHGWYPAWRFIVLTEVGPVQVLNVHLRPPTHPRGGLALATTPAIRRKEIEQYFPALRRDLPTIIAGDFNEGPLGRAIGYLRDRGFRSALREFRTPQFTWRWDTGLPDVKVQLDHIVYGGGLVPLQTYVIMAGESDHFPVIGVFARRGRIASTATRVSQL
jgi:endonuclease/exonuclease/phosphatase (EEP) superfamily protein YafD